MRKGLQISLKIGHFDIFLKNGPNDFFGFWPEVSEVSEVKKNVLVRSSAILKVLFELEIYILLYALKAIKAIAKTVSFIFLIHTNT